MGFSDILQYINWVDILILTLLVRLCYVGFERGLSSEITPVIGTYIALIISLHTYFQIGDVIATYTPLPSTFTYFISFVGLAVLINYIVFLFDLNIVKKIITVQIVSLYNKIGGLVAGALRGILLISIVVIALELVPIGYITYSVAQRSLLASRFSRIGETIHRETTACLGIKQNSED